MKRTGTFHRAWGLLLASACMAIAGCQDELPLSPTAPSRAIIVNASTASDSAIDQLAYGVSVALSDDDLRDQIRQDLRDSPFRYHRIHLTSYLRGPRDARVREAIAQALRKAPSDFAAFEAQFPPLELAMPKSLDRVEWAGGEDLQISGTLLSRREQIRRGRSGTRGYLVGGAPYEVIPDRYSPLKLLVIRRVSDLFPPDPEAIRASAPVQSGPTVSTFAAEHALQRELGEELAALFPISSSSTAETDNCDPETAEYECPGEPTGGGAFPVANGGAALPAHMTSAYCLGWNQPLDGASDRDADGIRDDCETEMALALTPLLNMSVHDEAPWRDPYWAASRSSMSDAHVQVIYAISYYEDPGDYMWGIEWHHGDSEFIILHLLNTLGTSNWGVRYATLSAHWQAGTYDATATYYFDDLEYPEGVPFPRIWAGINKHPNYRSKEVCDWGPGGAAYWDSCEGDYLGSRIGVRAEKNLGNFYHKALNLRNPGTRLLNCTQTPGRGGTECFWSDSVRFAGWHPAKDPSATPYTKVLEFFGF